MSASERVASMSPDELIAAITAGLDADEQAARAATSGPWRVADVTDYRSATVDGSDMLQDGGYDSATGTRSQVMRPLQVIPPDVDYGPVVDLADAEHIVRHDPSRVLADVESKRAILAVAAKLFAVDHDHEKDEDGVEFGHPIARRRMWDVLCALARPYLDQETP